MRLILEVFPKGTRWMRRLFIGALVMASWSVSAQEITREAERAASIGRDATQCALLAAGSGGRYAGQAVRLATFGYAHTLSAFKEFSAALNDISDSTALGPLTPFLRDKSAEFWAGSYFTNDANAVNQFIADAHPFNASDTYETTMALRRLEAEREFERRDCSSLGW